MVRAGAQPTGEHCDNCNAVFNPETCTDNYGAWQCGKCGLWMPKERGEVTRMQQQYL